VCHSCRRRHTVVAGKTTGRLAGSHRPQCGQAGTGSTGRGQPMGGCQGTGCPAATYECQPSPVEPSSTPSLGQTFTGQTKSLIPSSSTFAWKKSMTCLCLSSLTLFGLPLPSPYTFLQYSAMWPTVTSLRSRLSFNWVGRFR